LNSVSFHKKVKFIFCYVPQKIKFVK
jgi:hypothetical protein